MVCGKSFRIDELRANFEASYWVESDFNEIFRQFFFILQDVFVLQLSSQSERFASLYLIFKNGRRVLYQK